MTGDTNRVLVLSVLIGLFAGLSIVTFHIAIERIGWATLGAPVGMVPWATVAAPCAGAVVASALVLVAFPAARGSGINQTKMAIYASDGFIPFSSVAGKFLSCAVAIGSGNPLGPEDPALHMGAGIASALGRLFGLTRQTMRLIAPIGAAAGIAAAFNTPITAVLFVIEEVLSAWNAGVLGSIVLSAVSAVVVTRFFLGDSPLFRVPRFAISHPSELLVHAALGLACGLLAVGYVRAMIALRHRLARADAWGRLLGPAAAGLIVGFVGLHLPDALGAGYGTIDGALHGEFGFRALLLLAVAKVGLTALSFGVGTPGGLFAPTLFAGAMLGGGIGGLAGALSPAPSSAATAYVLVGMGAFFAATFRAPMTSIFMVFEVSASYVIILPVMVANTVAYLVSRQLQRVPLFAELAHEEGMDLPSLEGQREDSTIVVENAMLPPVLTLPASAGVEDARRRLAETGERVSLVDLGDGWSWVSADLLASPSPADGPQVLASMTAGRRVPVLYPDVSIDRALRALSTAPILPVVSRTQPRRLLGALTLRDVHRAYGIAAEAQDAGPGDAG